MRNLPDNDISRIPQKRAFTVTSDVGDTTTQSKELRRAAVSWEVADTDSFGIPTSYTASVTYRGEESYRTLEEYTVVTTYRGIATRPGNNMALDVEYVAIANTTEPDTTIPFEEYPEEEVISQEEEQEEKNTNWLARLIAAVLAGSLIPVIAYVLAPNARIDDNNEQTIKRIRLKKSGKSRYIYRMPTPLFERLYPPNEYYLIPRKNLVTDQSTLKMTTLTSEGDFTLFDGAMKDINTLDIDTIGKGDEAS